ncbi:hypothetical protein [Streptomyces pakalii]|uniref:Secreted protein n=1 Tax=Streptomyces pakalii TaxID=3036494 RepID=A0ABT7DHH6_9ACTN|nr:hypothetical protein [Streptomyces pakalii]MDJ1645283.1 hypothetical protein [Streptomyces pakalii]
MRTIRLGTRQHLLTGAALFAIVASTTPALAAGPAATGAPAAPSVSSQVSPLGVCGESRTATTSRVKAHWRIYCGTGNNYQKVTVKGWVRDIRKDKKCGQVYASFRDSRTKYSKKACGKKKQKNFTLVGRDERSLDGGATVKMRAI